MYPLQPYYNPSNRPGPVNVLRNSNNHHHQLQHNTKPISTSKSNQVPKPSSSFPKYRGPAPAHPRFTLPRTKASATVSITNANVNASTGSGTISSSLSSFGSGSGCGGQNVIPFPSAPIDIALDAQLTTTIVSPQDILPQHHYQRSRPISIHHRRRSPHPSHSQGPPPIFPNPNSRKHPFPSSISISVSPHPSYAHPRPKRPRKNKRVLADLQFGALIHRSIVSRRRAVGVDLGGGGRGGEEGDRMQVDEGDGDKDRELLDQEELLVERLWKKLVENGFLPVSFEDGDGVYSEREMLGCRSGFEVRCGEVEGMDVDTDVEERHLLFPPGLPLPLSQPPTAVYTPHLLSASSPAAPPTPSSPVFSSLSPPGLSSLPPASSPTPPSPPSSPSSPSPHSPQPPTHLSMPQLIASLIMRHRYRDTNYHHHGNNNNNKDRERGRERWTPVLKGNIGSGCGGGGDLVRGTGCGTRVDGLAKGGGIGIGIGIGIGRSPLSISVVVGTSADSAGPGP